MADRAEELIEQDLARALAHRKPVPTVCECGEPCATLSNGCRSRYCRECLDSLLDAGK